MEINGDLKASINLASSPGSKERPALVEAAYSIMALVYGCLKTNDVASLEEPDSLVEAESKLQTE